jgi:hypothetical protein
VERTEKGDGLAVIIVKSKVGILYKRKYPSMEI